MGRGDDLPTVSGDCEAGVRSRPALNREPDGADKRSVHRFGSVLLCLLVGLTAAVVPLGPSGEPPAPAGAAATDYPSVTIMGPARLSADQIAAYYASLHKSPKIPVSMKQLAQYYLDEGAAENVRGDLAFAQSALETGWFEFAGSMVNPGDYNYAGIGACDTCNSGTGFPSPQLGIRAQVQWLRNYADPTSRVANLHRPSMWTVAKYDNFFLKGKSPLWNTMGNGYWATSTTYAEKVLNIYQRMLTFHGLGFSDVRPSNPTLSGGRSVALNPSGGYYVLDADGAVLAFDGAPDYGSPHWGWDAARDLAVMPDGKGYIVLDAWGGLHRFGSARSGAIAGLKTPYWRGWSIARSLAVTPSGQGLVVLDGWGGLHARGDAPRPTGSPYWAGWDIARSVTVAPGGGYYVLDGWGGVHESGGAPSLGPGPYWPRWDIARDLVVTAGGWAVLDGFGGVHARGGLTGPGNIGWMPSDYWRSIATAGGRWVAVRKDGYLFTR